MRNDNQKIILFGAGKRGLNALSFYGKERVSFFCDTATSKVGTYINGVEVIDIDHAAVLFEQGYKVVITPFHMGMIPYQLEAAGITDYDLFIEDDYATPLTIYKKQILDDPISDSCLNEYVTKSRNIDPLSEPFAFRELSNHLLNDRKEKNINLMLWGESNFYGNAKALIDYGEIEDYKSEFFPVVSHEILPYIGVEHDYRYAVIMQGDYYKKLIHRHYPWIPFFSVGPYIQYVDGFYDREKIARIKKQYGITLMVFLPHSIENVSRNYNEKKLIDRIFDQYNEKFDTICLCVYWADIGRKVVEYATQKGLKIVSAGFRFDTWFDKRMRTIIDLSDYVLCFDYGSFVFYSLWGRKPMARLSFEEKKWLAEANFEVDIIRNNLETTESSTFENEFKKTINSEFCYNPEQMNFVQPFGGINIHRSKNYIKAVGDISYDIWQKSEGNLRFYQEAVKNVYKSYIANGEAEKSTILREAIDVSVFPNII